MRDISAVAAYSMEHDEMLTTQGKRGYRKASMVNSMFLVMHPDESNLNQQLSEW